MSSSSVNSPTLSSSGRDQQLPSGGAPREDVQQRLQQFGQTHLTANWERLTATEQRSLLEQIQHCDFSLLADAWAKAARTPQLADSSAADRPTRATAPGNVVRQPASPEDRDAWELAARTGAAELAAGRVAVITVAGGQGTRLGFDHPKGLFPIGPVSDRPLFQIFAEQILARSRRHTARLPWLIMTSDATHDETAAFFESRGWFGLPHDSVTLFRQGSLPALDSETGQVLLSGPGQLAMSPDGHGGLVSALQEAGLLNRLEREGIRHVFYHQVDNPTVLMADPALIGFHVLRQSELTTCVVRKTSPTERMGVLIELDGRTEIIEYSELTAEQAARCDADGQWIFWAGNTAIHVFDRDLLQRLEADPAGLPLHAARKVVPFLGSDGVFRQAGDIKQPNAIKLERFIFDALPQARRALIVEGDRDREFNPVKNATGSDSPATARAALDRIARDWARTAGLLVPPDRTIELSPLVALDSAELKQRVANGEVSASDLRISAD
jgi:UDP-N-acetylglucosamine/UDP-N-acetylgalactosamine diphosphorylase